MIVAPPAHYSLREVSQALGMSPGTASDIARRLRLPTRERSERGRPWGVDAEGYRRIAEFWESADRFALAS